MSTFVRYFLRGGSWYLNGFNCRSADRSYDFSPDTRYGYVGFRVVRGGAK